MRARRWTWCVHTSFLPKVILLTPLQDDFFRGILQNGQDPFANLIPGQEFWFDPNIVLT